MAAMEKGSKIVSKLFAIVIVASFTTSRCIAIETKPNPSEAAKSSAGALEFLRACCNATQYAKECYDSLLPQAESLNGNHIKVAAAATDIMVGHLEAFVIELRHLNSTTTEYTLDGCIKSSDESANVSKGWSAKLKSLEAVREGKMDEPTKGTVTKWINKVAFRFGECSMDLGNVPAGDTLPHELIAFMFTGITEALVNGIPLTSAASPTGS